MILYLDTSALVKLFVEEEGSDQVRQAVSERQLIVTHVIAYAEACATFARVAYDRGKKALFSDLRGNLDIQWAAWEVLSVTEALVRRAADLAGRYRLRAYDSLHLAAAESVFEIFRGHAPFHFAVFDTRLSDVARQAGMPLLDA